MRCVLLALLLASTAYAEDFSAVDFAGVTCGADDTSPRDIVVLPDGKVVEGKQLLAWTDSVGMGEAAKAKRSKVFEGSTWRGGWCVGESTVKAGKKSVTFVVTGAGELTGHGGDQLVGAAQLVSRAVPDKDAAKLPPPPKLAGKDDGGAWVKALSAGLATPETQAKLWAAKRTDLVLVGSAPGEVFKGAAAATTLPKWKLKLALDGGLRTGTVNNSREALAYVFSNVIATPVKGGPSVTYRAFFVLLADHFDETDEDKRPEDDTWHLVLAHFSR
ncbi:MAG: hypothetical protein JNL83_37315 [Myxococcales bacterium]|nr:hypothetical protein [Myxococcales bacterium]